MSDTSNPEVGNDPLARQLERLAPTVGMAESRALFERSRRETTSGGGDGPRWWLAAAVLALVVGGIVGLWALARDDTTVPSNPVDDPAEEPATDEQVTEGIVEPGNGFEVLLVAETNLAVGQAWLATGPSEYDAIQPASGVTPPDFTESIALVTIQPDNACPDTLTHFEVARGNDGIPVWTPMFEEQAEACEDPLLSWMYVVTIDRAALGDEAAIRIPADDIYQVDEQLLRYVADSADDRAPAIEDPDVVIEPTGLTVPLPPVGAPAIHNTSAGLVWVVAHDDGSVSVLPAAVDEPTEEGEGGVTNLATLVVASDSGDTFMGGQFQWDAWGRAISGGRANDLVGYGGQVDGDEVEILTSTATRVPGEAEANEIDFAESYQIPDLGQAIDVPTFYTLSSSGPIWRLFDATLVVEDGNGRICEVDTDVPVDQLATCDDAEFVLDTGVTSTQPEITSWYPAPILAFQDPVRQFTKVIPLAGSMGLNTAALDPPTETTTPAITGAEAVVGSPTSPAADGTSSERVTAEVLTGAPA
jgi:hypothetical protein